MILGTSPTFIVDHLSLLPDTIHGETGEDKAYWAGTL